MKRLSLLFIGALFLASCDETAPESDSLLDGETQESETVVEETVSANPLAVSLYTTWLKAELRKDAKANKKVQFGTVLEVLDTASLENKHYTKVKVVDGTEGWIKTYLIASDAKRAITTKEVSLYKDADILALSDSKIPAGTMVAVENEEVAGYIFVIGAERKVKGYIKGQKGISDSDLNLEVGMLREKALALEGQAKIDAVKAIVANEDYVGSAFYGELQNLYPSEGSEELEEVTEEEVINEVLEGIEEEL